MSGVSTALVGFIFVCVVFPHLVKNRTQFYAGMAFTCFTILLDGLGTMVVPADYSPFRVFIYFVAAGFQVVAVLLLFLAAGGITWRKLAGDMANAFEVIRRGSDSKEVIVPLSGERPRPRADRVAEKGDTPQERIVINDPVVVQHPPTEKIPLE